MRIARRPAARAGDAGGSGAANGIDDAAAEWAGVADEQVEQYDRFLGGPAFAEGSAPR
jgi:hypothetical protein